MAKLKLEYIWLDGYTPTTSLRVEKQRILHSQLNATRDILADFKVALKSLELTGSVSLTTKLNLKSKRKPEYYHSISTLKGIASLKNIDLEKISISELKLIIEWLSLREHSIKYEIKKLYNRTWYCIDIERNKPFIFFFAFIDFIQNLRKEVESSNHIIDSIIMPEMAIYSFQYEFTKRSLSLFKTA